MIIMQDSPTGATPLVYECDCSPTQAAIASYIAEAPGFAEWFATAYATPFDYTDENGGHISATRTQQDATRAVVCYRRRDTNRNILLQDTITFAKNQ